MAAVAIQPQEEFGRIVLIEQKLQFAKRSPTSRLVLEVTLLWVICAISAEKPRYMMLPLPCGKGRIKTRADIMKIGDREFVARKLNASGCDRSQAGSFSSI